MKYLAVFAFLVFLPVLVAAQTALSADDKKIIADFELRARRYIEMREAFRQQLPKLPKEATPEQIQANKEALQQRILAARVNARQGDIFTQSASQLLRAIIKSEFKGYEGDGIRKNVLDADTKGIPLVVNAIYPDSKELVTMSAPLLLTLPQLPKELRYRYVGRSLVLLDRDTSMILDFMKDALP